MCITTYIYIYIYTCIYIINHVSKYTCTSSTCKSGVEFSLSLILLYEFVLQNDV